MSVEILGTNVVTDAAKNKHEVFLPTEQKHYFDIYTFLKKLSLDDECAKNGFVEDS